MSRVFKHLTLEQRTKIKEMLDNGYSKTEIAKVLGVAIATIYREVDRGIINGEYSPIFSEKRYRQHLLEKGTQPILSIEPGLAEYIAKLILIDKLNLTQIMEKLQKNEKFKQYPKSRVTISNAIDNGLIPNVTRQDLLPDTTTVFNNGQVHIAKWVREALGLHDGDELEFKVVENKLIFSKKRN